MTENASYPSKKVYHHFFTLDLRSHDDYRKLSEKQKRPSPLKYKLSRDYRNP